MTDERFLSDAEFEDMRPWPEEGEEATRQYRSMLADREAQNELLRDIVKAAPNFSLLALPDEIYVRIRQALGEPT